MKKNVIINSLALIGVGVATGIAVKKVNKYFNKVKKMPNEEKMEEINRLMPEIQILLIVAALWALNDRVTAVHKIGDMNTMQIIDNMDVSKDDKLNAFKQLRKVLHHKDLVRMADEFIADYTEVN